MILMLAAFVVVVVQRHQIRLWWYVRQLDSSQPAQALALYDHIAAELAASERTLLSATRHSRADVRLIAAGLVGRLDNGQAMSALDALLRDDDEDVREVAAMMLAFDKRPDAWERLKDASRSKDAPIAAAAVSVINRTLYDDGPCVLASALRMHASPQVRAQAAESLIMMLVGSAPPNDPDLSAIRAHELSILRGCGVYRALAGALSDEGAFDGKLAYERELAEVVGQAVRQGIPVDDEPLDSTSSGRRTVGGFIRSSLDARFGLPASVYAGDPEAIAEALRGIVDRTSTD
ncbi:MAG: HEAT repeat domain-containing protein [Phycisphaerales bacterium]|nr:HEAT repeat domain-containing protein [Phycisphaerales bacterium]